MPDAPTAVPSEVVSDVEQVGEAPRLSRRFFNLKTLLSFAAGFAVLAALFSRANVEVDAILAHLGNINPGAYLAALAIYYLTFPIHALRWRQLLWNVGLSPEAGVRLPSVLGLARIILMSWFANCVVPAKLGDAYRAYLLKERSGASFSSTIGTVLAERAIDVLLIVGLLVIAALLVFKGALPSPVDGILLVGLALVLVLALGLLGMRHLGGPIRRLVPVRFELAYGRLEEGTFGAFKFNAIPVVLGYSLMIWAIEAIRLYLVSRALGVALLSIGVVLFVALSAALLTAVPLTPAGLGFVESGVVGTLLLANHLGLAPGVDQNLATSIAILDRSISYWSVVVAGLVVHARRH